MKFKIFLYLIMLAAVLIPQWFIFEPNETELYEYTVRSIYFFLGLLGGDNFIAWIYNKVKDDKNG